MNSHHRTYHTVLTIGHSDPAGGTGVQADVKTISALGCYPLTIVTAISSRGTDSRADIQVLDPAVISQQCRSAVIDHKPGAVKIGLIACEETAEVVSAFLAEMPHVPIVIEPIAARLPDQECIPNRDCVMQRLRQQILPRTTLLTPNVPEAEYLTGISIRNGDDMEQAAQMLLDTGAEAILLKGGKSKRAHSDDVLAYRANGEPVTFTWFHSGRVQEYTSAGAGSTLSSAIAAGLSRGRNIREATEDAKIFLNAALRA
ncbi:MAG: bifunctional hydroxymethylpyrimidine kinase/phosphomethylpyrimidine kinase, partial [Spirochaetota bacterium]